MNYNLCRQLFENLTPSGRKYSVGIQRFNKEARLVAGFFEVPSRFELLYTVLQTVA